MYKFYKCGTEKAILLECQSKFDKLVKSTKRKWQRNCVFELEQANLDDPHAFWAFIKNTRWSKKSRVPMETYDVDGNVTMNPHEFLEKWVKDFGSLLTLPEKNYMEKAFAEQISNSNKEAELNMT